MTIHAIRLHNLRALIGQRSIADFAQFVGTNAAYVSQIFSDRTKANVGSKLARQIEAAHQLPKGWMDERHDERPSIPLEAEQLVADFMTLPHGLQQHLRPKAGELRQYADSLPPFIRKALGGPPDDSAGYRAWEREIEADMALRKQQHAIPVVTEVASVYDAPPNSPAAKRPRAGPRQSKKP